MKATNDQLSGDSYEDFAKYGEVDDSHDCKLESHGFCVHFNHEQI